MKISHIVGEALTGMCLNQAKQERSLAVQFLPNPLCMLFHEINSYLLRPTSRSRRVCNLWYWTFNTVFAPRVRLFHLGLGDFGVMQHTLIISVKPCCSSMCEQLLKASLAPNRYSN